MSVDSLTFVSDYANMREVSDLMASAFVNSPLWKFLFDDGSADKVREKTMADFYEINLKLLELCDGFHGHFTLVNEKLVGAFCLVETKNTITMYNKVQAGLLKLPFIVGFGVTASLLRADAFIENEFSELIKDGRPYVMLERMVVTPKMQGKQIGSKSLIAAFNDKTKPYYGLPCILCTQSESNVRFYERIGFKIVKSSEYIGIPNFFMIREPITDVATTN